LKLVHQNDLKTQKILIWNKEKNKILLNFFKSTFETQKQTEISMSLAKNTPW